MPPAETRSAGGGLRGSTETKRNIMKHTSLKSGVAALALLACSAQAQSAPPIVNQAATNNGVVANSGDERLGTGAMGAGASASVGATGAATATAVTGINQNFSAPSSFGTVTQGATNTTSASVTNDGTVAIGERRLVAPAPSSVGQGGSLSVGASGAASSVSMSGIGTPATGWVAPSTGSISQTSVNNADDQAGVAQVGVSVRNTGTIDGSAGGLSVGQGGSVNISATGAAASVGVSAVGPGTFSAPGTGTITQKATNEVLPNKGIASIANTGTINLGGAGKGDLTGDGASVAVGASGAVTSIGLSFIGATAVSGSNALPGAGGGFGNLTGSGTTMGNISQTSTNTWMTIDNQAAVTVGDVAGEGASVSARATGALASVSIAQVNTASEGAFTTGTITQKAMNNGDTGGIVTNTTVNNRGTISAGALAGMGSSASIAASGAVTSLNVASIGAGTLGDQSTVGTITQTSDNVSQLFFGTTYKPNVTNVGSITLSGGITGNGASASVSATGAGAFVSFATIK